MNKAAVGALIILLLVGAGIVLWTDATPSENRDRKNGGDSSGRREVPVASEGQAVNSPTALTTSAARDEPSPSAVAPPTQSRFSSLYGALEESASGGIVIQPLSGGEAIRAPFLVYVSSKAVWPYDISEPTAPLAGSTFSGFAGAEYQLIPALEVYEGRNGRCFVPRRGRFLVSLVVAAPDYSLLIMNEVATNPDGESPAVVQAHLHPSQGPRIEGKVILPSTLRNSEVLVQWSPLPPYAPPRVRLVPGPRPRSAGQQFHQSFRKSVGIDSDGRYVIEPTLVTSFGVLRILVGDCLVTEIQNLKTTPGTTTKVPTIQLPELRLGRIVLSIAGLPMRFFAVRATGCVDVPTHQKLVGNAAIMFSDQRGSVTAAFVPNAEVELVFQLDFGRLSRIGPDGYSPNQDPVVGYAADVVDRLLHLQPVRVGPPSNASDPPDVPGAIPISIPWEIDGAIRVNLRITDFKQCLANPAVVVATSRLQRALEKPHGAPAAVAQAARKLVDTNDPSDLLRVMLAED